MLHVTISRLPIIPAILVDDILLISDSDGCCLYQQKNGKRDDKTDEIRTPLDT
jgi:hypothetical protein